MELIGIVFFIISSFFSNENQHIAAEKTTVSIDPKNKTIEIYQQNLFTVFEKPSDSISVLNELRQLEQNKVVWSEKLNDFPDKSYQLIHDKKNNKLHLQISLKFKNNASLSAFAIEVFQNKVFSLINIPYWNLSSKDGELVDNYWHFPLNKAFTFSLNPFDNMPDAFKEKKQNLLPIWKQSKKMKKDFKPHNKKLPTNPSPKQIITAPIVVHPFFNKKGEVIEKEQIYLQLSVQDYFVKFCESTVSRKEFENYLMQNYSKIKAMTLEIEYKDGNWDDCNSEENIESRIGPYVIIHRIVH